MPVPPPGVRAAAITSLMIGLVDLALGWLLASMAWGAVGCLFTWPCALTGLPPPGLYCGCLGYLIVPIGILEIVSGIVALSQPTSGARLLNVSSALGISGFFFGGLSSGIGGVVVQMLLRDEEVANWLEDTRQLDGRDP